MKQPRVIDEDDPVLEHVRALCLAYPDAVEMQSWGRPTFRVNNKIFAVLGSSVQMPHTIIFKPDPNDRDALVGAAGFTIPPYWGTSGWLAVDAAERQVEWDHVRELVDASYRLIAPKRSIRVLNDLEGFPRPDDDGSASFATDI